MDGVIHLVGGWRGAQGITDQSDEDWDFLERGAVTTLRNVTRVFYDDLAASGHRPFRHGVLHRSRQPDGGGASYVAAKAAAEAWTLAVAEGFRRAAGRTADSAAAAVVFVVKASWMPACAARHPERKFPGFTDVEDLAPPSSAFSAAPPPN